jgi:catalase
MVNEQKERFWVKFHFLAEKGAAGLTQAQAKIIAGEDPNWLGRDLRESIERRDFPRWAFAIQVMPEADGYRLPWTFDATKVWPHADYPLIPVGMLELNRNVIDYFTETEQVAFSPSNAVPGIGFSPDRLLQVCIVLMMSSFFFFLTSL